VAFHRCRRIARRATRPRSHDLVDTPSRRPRPLHRASRRAPYRRFYATSQSVSDPTERSATGAAKARNAHSRAINRSSTRFNNTRGTHMHTERGMIRELVTHVRGYREARDAAEAALVEEDLRLMWPTRASVRRPGTTANGSSIDCGRATPELTERTPRRCDQTHGRNRPAPVSEGKGTTS